MPPTATSCSHIRLAHASLGPRLSLMGRFMCPRRMEMFMLLACHNDVVVCKKDLALIKDARSLLQFRHILFLNLLNYERDRETLVELAYLNFNFQAGR